MDNIDLKTLVKIIKVLDKNEIVEEFRLRVGNKIVIIKDAEIEPKSTLVENKKFDI